MGDIPGPLVPAPPPQTKSNLPMLYYGLLVVGTAAFVLAVYNLIVIRWCAHREGRSHLQGTSRPFGATPTQSFENRSMSSVSSFKYKKEGGAQDQTFDYECAVCLSAFEDGEDLRQLPRCKHSFHAPCIDMWLYSHSDCPLCRAAVEPLLPQQRQEENSQEELLNSSASV